MPKIYYQADCDINVLKDKTVAVIGYGSQGHAHALNLKDSGVNVIVGLYDGSKSRARAEAHGLTVMNVADATKAADIIMVLIPDERQADMYYKDIAPNLTEGKALQEKTQKAQKSWAQKEQNLQSEAAQLQEKYQKGLITTNDAQAQQQSIEKRVASYQSSAQKEAQALDEENYVFTNRAQDLLHRAVQEINGDKKYKLIINATALIDADSTLNITPAVLAKVNELYAADKKAAKK